MLAFWYVCDGNVETYNEQETTKENSFIVIAKSPEDALIKVLRYYQGALEHGEVLYNGKTITAIF